MPFVSIRPVPCKTFVGGEVPPIGLQIFQHYKNTPTEYHDVFSCPEKMFSMGIITPKTFRKIITTFPEVFDRTKEYIIKFMFEKGLWDLIPLSVPFSIEKFYFIKYSTIINNDIILFMNGWISIHHSEKESKKLIIDVMRFWKSVHNIDMNTFISYVELLGDVGVEYLNELNNKLNKRLSLKIDPLIYKSYKSYNYDYDCGSDDDTLSPSEVDDYDREILLNENEHFNNLS